MTKISQGNKKITTRKIPATNNKVLVHTGSLLFFKKYQQPIIKFWSVLAPVRETVRLKNPEKEMDWLSLETPMVDAEEKIVTF